MHELLNRAVDLTPGAAHNIGGHLVIPGAEDRGLEEFESLLASPDAVGEALENFERKVRDDADIAMARFGQPKLVKTIRWKGKTQVKVWDYRHFTSSNLGPITPYLYVDHIPVIHQAAGLEDINTLWRVLVGQGLMVHRADDAGGNVAMFTGLNVGNYQAKGANSISVGNEHMHYGINDPWSRKQMMAAAFASWQAYEYANITTRYGSIGSGNGYVTVRKRGHVTHKRVSAAAGYFDRSDPGPTWENGVDTEVAELARFYNTHHHF